MSRFSSLASAFVVLRRDKTARQLPPSSSYSSSSLVPYKILIYEDEHEDEDEKNQIRSHASALRPQPSTLYHGARMKLQSFFFDQTGRFGGWAESKSYCRSALAE